MSAQLWLLLNPMPLNTDVAGGEMDQSLSFLGTPPSSPPGSTQFIQHHQQRSRLVITCWELWRTFWMLRVPFLFMSPFHCSGSKVRAQAHVIAYKPQ